MKYLIFVLILTNLYGCKRDSNIIPPRAIDLTKGLKQIDKKVMLSNFVDSIEYIIPETTNRSLIDRIDKVMIDDSLVFICNKEQFFIFCRSGQFLRSIGTKGKGPGEFLRIYDFTINTLKDEIYIYDSDQHKIIRYSYKGKFELEFKLNSFPSRVACLDNKYLMCSWVLPDYIGNDNYGLSLYTLDGKFVKRSFNREHEGANLGMASTSLTRLKYYSDSLTYWEINSDIIYRITSKGEPIPRYRIDYKSSKNDKDMSKLHEGIFRYSTFLESEKYLFFLKGIYDKKPKHLIYNKYTNEIVSPYFDNPDLNLVLRTGFLNDIDGGFPFLPYDAFRDGKLYCFFYPYELKSLLNQKIYDGIEIINEVQQLRLYNIINNSKNNGNPIIMVVTLK